MATKVMVSFPEEFLTEVDRVAREEHRSRSELVREALRLYIGLRQRPSPQDSPAAPAVREAPVATHGTLANQDREIAREFRQRLAAVAPIRDLRLFGSRAPHRSGLMNHLACPLEPEALGNTTKSIADLVSVISHGYLIPDQGIAHTGTVA